MSVMRIELLGPLDVRTDGGAAIERGAQVRTALIRLALDAQDLAAITLGA